MSNPAPNPWTADRELVFIEAGTQSPVEIFRSDMLMQSVAASRGLASIRLYRHDRQRLCLGRFHRRDPGATDVERRFSGGRPVPVGPGIQCFSMVVPSVAWLDRSAAGLRPDQVLNRALRPWLTLLRALGVDAYYPGRDLVTVGGRTVAHAAFTVAIDGVVTVEGHIGVEESFSSLAELASNLDPAGVGGFATDAFLDAADLKQLGGAVPEPLEFARLAGECAAKELAAKLRIDDLEGMAQGPWRPAAETAFESFRASPGPAADGISAASPSMLGMVESSARLEGDRLYGLEITGDIIAPFHTIQGLADSCEAQPFRMPAVRRAFVGVLSRPRSFLLGVMNLDEVVGRMS